MKRITLEQVASALESKDNILLLCHAHPDGDTLGSATALAMALAAKGKTVTVRCGDTIPKIFSFMFRTLAQTVFEPEFIVAIDVADERLLGDTVRENYSGRIDLCIDHHGSNMGYADELYLEASSASTAEIIFNLLGIMGCPIDADIASALFTGVSTDTGCFRYSNTTSRTHRIASELIDRGADSVNIIRYFFETKTKSYAALEKLALDKLELFLDEKCALTIITMDMYEKTGSDESDTDRIASLPRQIEGVLVGIMLREIPGGSFKASVRTFGDVDASAICKRLGGGGHVGAAGCTISGPAEAARDAILAQTEVELRGLV